MKLLPILILYIIKLVILTIIQLNFFNLLQVSDEIAIHPLIQKIFYNKS